MRPVPRFDPRTSPTHRPLLETPGTLAYLPHALRWASDPAIALPALVFGAFIGMFASSWLGVLFVALFGSAALAWLLTLQQRAVFGFGDAPTLSLDDLSCFRGNAEALVEVGAIVVAGYGVLYLAAPELARWYAWSAGALLPAMFVLVAVEESLWPALDPRRVLRVSYAGGPLGWALAVASGAGAERLGRTAAEFLRMLDAEGLAGLMEAWTPNATAVAGGVGGLWLAALAVHLHGHTLHHRRDRARLAVVLAAPDEDERAAAACSAAVRRVADGFAAAMQRGDRVVAERWAAAAPPDGVGDVAYLHELWESLLERRLHTAAVLVARRLVVAAARDKRYALAVAVYTEALRLSPSFTVAPSVRLALAQAALASNDQANFERLTRIAPERWPDDAAAVELAYLRAGWLVDRNDTGGARALLAMVLEREHPLRERIAALHSALAE